MRHPGDMARGFQDHRQRHRRVHIVVHHQYLQAGATVRARCRRVKLRRGLRGGQRRQRQAHREHAARIRAATLGGHAAAMHLDQAPHQRQADAEPALRAVDGAADLAEHLEHAGQCIAGDPDPGVADHHHGLFSFTPHRQPDAAARRRVLGGVVEQVGHHLGNAGRVGVHQQRLVRHIHLQRMLAGLDQRQAGLDRAGQDGAQVGALALEFELAAADAGDVEQVVDQVHHVADLALHHFPDLAHRRRIVAAQAHHRQAVADRRQRITQLVRQGGQELGLAAVGLGQVVGQPAQFLFRALARRDVGKQQRHLAAVRAADAGGVDIEPARHGRRLVLEARRLARERHPAIGVEPERVQAGQHLARGAAHGIHQAGVLLEHRVHLQEAVVDRLAGRVEDHLEDAEALVDRLEQGAIAFFAGAQLFLYPLALGGVEDDRDQALEFAAWPAQRIDAANGRQQ